MAAASSDESQLIIPETAQSVEVKLGCDITVPCHLSPEICAVDMKIKWFKETDCVCIYEKREVTEARDYMNKVSLFTEEIIKGNVSLILQRFTESDLGDYLCQVTIGDKTEEITVKVQDDTVHTSDSRQEKQITPTRKEPRGSLFARIAAGALIGAVCGPSAALGVATGAVIGAVEEASRGGAGGSPVEGPSGQPLRPAEAADHRKISFLKVRGVLL
ncbi:butyrophilin-like protein 1 [Misgurnus anguillicaudatus]|uniref:butyrophilin-like protein 1 n=1 Tax=Misgurnus anguillicaudatus TaxID=75329 RepID=UPI003CCF25BA